MALVNYRELPQAVFSDTLPHFGIAYRERERAIMAEAARFDAKTPQREFADDSAEKRHRAGSARAGRTASGRDLSPARSG